MKPPYVNIAGHSEDTFLHPLEIVVATLGSTESENDARREDTDSDDDFVDKTKNLKKANVNSYDNNSGHPAKAQSFKSSTAAKTGGSCREKKTRG